MSHRLVGGRFRLGRVIGRGNVGEVHQAEDLQATEGAPERTVAVKTILRRRTGAQIDTGGDAKAVQRFNREVRIMRRLLHPNPTRLVAGGIDEDTDYIPETFQSESGGLKNNEIAKFGEYRTKRLVLAEYAA
ncbi:hypothetical protein GCM10022384_06920 [Streptomyces marokkonensis]|uniref:Protein kinase domain-containing protein n=1 Tax=Streptomyces marokkonensis TaxID=324855 RepID=A0ABP7NXS2_9ACTN